VGTSLYARERDSKNRLAYKNSHLKRPPKDYCKLEDRFQKKGHFWIADKKIEYNEGRLYFVYEFVTINQNYSKTSRITQGLGASIFFLELGKHSRTQNPRVKFQQGRSKVLGFPVSGALQVGILQGVPLMLIGLRYKILSKKTNQHE